MKLCIAKTVAVASLLTGTAQADLPVAYDIVELGALERVPQQDGSRARQSSFGYALNNNGDRVGHSFGEHLVINEREVNGIIIREEATLDLLQPLDFTDLSRTITPEDRELGFGTGELGIYATSVNENSIISGYGFDNEFYPVLNENEDGICEETNEVRQELRRAYYFDLNNNLVQVPTNYTVGTPLGSETEYFGTAFLDSNNDYFVGYGGVVTEKGDCDNLETITNRGMIFDVNTSSPVFIGVLEESENEANAQSVIRGINQANQFVGWSHKVEDEERIARAIIGSVGSSEITEVTGLSGGTNSFLWKINNSGSYAVGSSTKESNLNLLTAFYYDPILQVSEEIGYLNEQFPYSEAYSVNNDNIVVGVSQISRSPINYSAFAYDIDGTEGMVDLNDLIDCDAGWTLSEAREINDNGWIIGTGTTLVEQEDGQFSGEVRGFLLIPRATEADRSCETQVVSNSGGFFNPLALLFLSVFGLILRRRKA
ncbi:MAG: DUF3466 family protein [Gammaproteobacteria bacterium]|nr:DUF3466 family protein [Gammaproteobacteria bacterium]